MTGFLVALVISALVGWISFGHFGYLAPESKASKIPTIVDEDDFDEDGK